MWFNRNFLVEVLKVLEEKQIFNCEDVGMSCERPQENFQGYELMT